jgi:hypothetical protein
MPSAGNTISGQRFQLIILKSGFGWKKLEKSAYAAGRKSGIAEIVPTNHIEIRIWLEQIGKIRVCRRPEIRCQARDSN